MTITDWIQAISTVVLVIITAVYAWLTHSISKATEKQAEASAKAVEEMREQRIASSRPVIIQKAIVETETEWITFGSKDWFSYFEVYNAGNGPALEIEISLLDNEKKPIYSERETFLRAEDKPIRFHADEHSALEESNYYLVAEYQSILSRSQKIWYQTKLPFTVKRASEIGKIYVIAGELEFTEVSEKERIDAFGSRSKPQ